MGLVGNDVRLSVSCPFLGDRGVRISRMGVLSEPASDILISLLP